MKIHQNEKIMETRRFYRGDEENFIEAESDAKLLKKIEIGLKVKIQKSLGSTATGTVTQIFNQHEKHNDDGIEVEIDDYYEGNVKQILTTHDDDVISIAELLEKIDKHESKTFEMKAAFKYNLELSERLGKPMASEAQKRKIVEEVAGFMNTDGGIVAIGVDNNGKIIGLKHEYELQSDYSPSKDPRLLRDDLQLEIVQALEDYLDDNKIFAGDRVRVFIKTHEEKDICCIKVEKSEFPVFVKIHGAFRDSKLKKDKPGGETVWKCWIRRDNSIKCLDFDEFMATWSSLEDQSKI